ncbi:putative inner membrane transporter YedA [bacterium BMS3Abin04]|nr:putative inner membrane transporter YedA [bacterium BMS3Abin04]
MKSESLKIYSGFILICLLWGSTWLAIRIGLDAFPPMFAAGLRFSLASVFILIFMLLQGVSIQKDKLSVKLYLIMGFFSFVVPFGLVYWAEQYIPSGLASILFGSFPFFVIIYSKMALPHDSVDIFKIIGVTIGFLGIVIIFSDDFSLNFTLNLWGMLAVVLSAAMQGGIAVIIKKYGNHLNPLSMNLIPLLIGGIVLLFLGIMFEDTADIVYKTPAVLSVVYLAFFGTLMTFTIYYWLMKRMNVVILSLSAFITPIIAVLIGWLFAAEKLSERDIMGSSLVLIGILFANFKGLRSYFKKRSAG